MWLPNLDSGGRPCSVAGGLVSHGRPSPSLRAHRSQRPMGGAFSGSRGIEPDRQARYSLTGSITDPGGAKLERHVPYLPLSRDHFRLEALRRSLAVNRMVFGQPRQEDVLMYLLSRLPPGRVAALMQKARNDLSPPQASTKTSP